MHKFDKQVSQLLSIQHSKSNWNISYPFIQHTTMSYQKTKGQPRNIQQTKKRNNQIINNLKQTLSKPTIVQAQRTLKIMQKLIDRMSLFMNLDSQFLIKFNQINNPQKLKLNKTLIQQLSPEILDLIVKEAKMESQFRGYISLEQQIKDGEVIEEQKLKEYERIKKDMAYTFRSLLRGLEKTGSNDIEILKSLKMNSAPNNQVANIHQALSNYKIIMQKTLATAAQEQQSHTRLIEELQMKIESLQKTKNNCEKELLKLRQDRAKHAEDKKQEMDKLRAQIRDVESNRTRDLDLIVKKSKDMNDSLNRDFKKKQDNLRTLIAQERNVLTKLRAENNTSQIKSRQEKQNNEAILAENINIYDAEMAKRNAERAEKDQQLKKKSDQLNNLKRHFLEIEEQRKRQEALIEADRLRKHQWELLEKKKAEASTKIKQAYRLWKNKNKKKKKKKK